MTLDAVLRRAIRRAPCSIRALAREAGVSHVMLAAIVNADERATPRVAKMVAGALDKWAARCAGEAAAIRAAVEDRSTKEDA
jgi:lambda repressor-like predicted transcriptional regulator